MYIYNDVLNSALGQFRREPATIAMVGLVFRIYTQFVQYRLAGQYNTIFGIYEEQTMDVGKIISSTLRHIP